MNEIVLLVGKNSEDLVVTRNLLGKLLYTSLVASSLEMAKKILFRESCRVVVLDFETLTLNNTIIRDFKLEFPRVSIVIISKKKFHPELKRAITDHIYACILKPVDPDELAYWLTSIHRNEETISRDTHFSQN